MKIEGGDLGRGRRSALVLGHKREEWVTMMKIQYIYMYENVTMKLSITYT